MCDLADKVSAAMKTSRPKSTGWRVSIASALRLRKAYVLMNSGGLMIMCKCFANICIVQMMDTPFSFNS